MSAAAGPLAAGTPDPAGPPPGLEVRARDGEARRVVRLVRRHGGDIEITYRTMVGGYRWTGWDTCTPREWARWAEGGTVLHAPGRER